MIEANDVVNKLAAYVAREVLKQPSRKISPDERLLSTGLVDSFSLVDLALFVESTFGVRIHDTELNAGTFDSLQQLAVLILTRSQPGA